MRTIVSKYIIFLFLIIVGYSKMSAQFYSGSQLTFGKNRVQYADRFWSYYRFPKFDTYFYQGGKELASYTAQKANQCLSDIEQLLEYNFDDRFQFVIYNKLSELKQSNIGLLSEDIYNVGGTTYITGSKIMLYFDGDHRNLDRQIKAGIAQIIINQIVYGDNIGSNVKNNTLLSLPDWYLQGLISYLSRDWDTDVDNKVHDGIITGKYEKFNDLMGEDALYAGHSIWRFVAEKYGVKNIPNIVYMTKMSRNIESGFLYILGISFKNLTREWLDYYDKQYYEADKQRTEPEGEKLPVKLKKTRVYQQFKISPDKKYAVFTSNELGQLKIWLYNFETKKTKRIYRKGHKLEEKTDYSYPLLAWHPSSQFFSYFIEHKGKMLMYHYNVEDKTKEWQRFFILDKILDYSYSKDGKMMAMSAVSNGSTDIYIFNRVSKTFEQITKDPWDELYPRFIDNDKSIIFSSNRTSDTLKPVNTDYPEYSPSLDLYIYDYQKRSPYLIHATNTPLTDEIHANEYQDSYVSYLSDKNGITNRYIMHVDSVISQIDTIAHYRKVISSKAITNNNRSTLEEYISPTSQQISSIYFKDNKYSLIYSDVKDASKENEIKLEDSYYRTLTKEVKVKTDSIPKKERNKESSKSSKKRISFVTVDEEKTDSSKIDINNYQFGNQPSAADSSRNRDSLAISKKDSVKSFILPRQRTYEVSYHINQVVTQVDFSYLNNSYQAYTGGGGALFINSGIGGFIKLGISDLFENYRISLGLRIPSSLSNEYVIQFENLLKRNDEQWVFHRQVLENQTDYSLYKLYTHEIKYLYKMPLDVCSSIRTTITGRHDQLTFLSTDQANLKEPDQYRYWAGLKLEYVFDNTRNKGVNLYYGTRAKIFAEEYFQIDQTEKNMTVIGFDIRNYKKIHKTFIWANRLAGSTSLGTQRLMYYMGGVDTWLMPKFNDNTPIDYNINYAYQTLATNMRGFHQNIRNGHNFMVFNSELRLPVFKYFSSKPIKSDFFRNFQIIGFSDIGTAWNGLDPYDKNSALYKKVITNGPLTITLENIKEPIVGGYGFGLRSRILGYFLRADWAWGVEDGIVQPRVFYLSMSLDF